MCNVYGYTQDSAKEFNAHMTTYCYGLALGMVTGALDLTEEEVSDCLRTEFRALVGVYGAPKAGCLNNPGKNINPDAQANVNVGCMMPDTDS